MDDHRIEVFLTVVKNKSFSRAAEELHCSQSAITQTVKSLEAELNCPLLLRKHTGIEMTSQGQALLPRFQAADQALIALKQEAKALQAREAAPIRIGTYSSVANTFLPQLLQKYRRQNPAASFQIRIGSDRFPDWLLGDEVDLIFADQPHARNFRWYPLLEDPYVGVVTESMLKDPAQTSIRREDFFRLPFIMSDNNNYRAYIDQLPENRLDVSCDDDSTLIHMVSQGLGAALLPSLCVCDLPANVRALSIRPEFHRVIGVITAKEVKANIKPFLDFVLEEMGPA